MGLAEIIKQYLRKGESGVISVKLQNENHLLKVYIENGEVMYVTLGTFKNEECFSKLKNAVPIEHFFLRGVTPPQKIEGGCTDKFIDALGLPSAESLKTKTGMMITPEKIQKLEKEFIELIGPIGKLIIDDLFSKISYSRGNSMPEDEYKIFVDSLIKELPAHEQEKFSSKYKI
ncbi:MAG: hypothetical protein N2257_03320 [Thermodesulfovibrionales bacterium]|nr:hypothetical protein [Thermodesulfovibrionales bacterium]